MLLNCLFNGLGLLMLLLCSGAVRALTSDSTQPIEIVSEQQSFDVNSNRMTFSGQVVVTQGTIKIQADRVVITRVNHQAGQEQVEATGAPATFYQLLEDQQPIRGSGRRMQYDAQRGILILQQQAELNLRDHRVQSDRMTYDLVKQRVQADSASTMQRVKMVLLPEQLPAKGKKAP